MLHTQTTQITIYDQKCFPTRVNNEEINNYEMLYIYSNIQCKVINGENWAYKESCRNQIGRQALLNIREKERNRRVEICMKNNIGMGVEEITH
jgi:hypothetical protein